MDLLRQMVRDLRMNAASHEEALSKIVEFVYSNSQPTDLAPFKEEFAQLKAEGLIQIGFYEEILMRCKIRRAAGM